MITIVLGAEGEYGKRLARYLETHMDEPIRLHHFTLPGQWDLKELPVDIFILRRSFFLELADQSGVIDANVIWITEKEKEEGYCLFHAPGELIEMIRSRLGKENSKDCLLSCSPRISAVFSPVFEPESFRIMQFFLKEKALYLGMEDIGEMMETLPRKEYKGRDDFFIRPKNVQSDYGQSLVSGNHLGDLCYFIHLRDEEILSRIKEISIKWEGHDILPSPPFFLPLLELTREDYAWFFEKLRSDVSYSHIWIGTGCGMIGSGRILPHLDSLFLLSGREDILRRTGCDQLMHSVQSGWDSFHGSCEVLFREDVLADA